MDLSTIKDDKALAAIQAELDAEREKLAEERRRFEREKAEAGVNAAASASAAEIQQVAEADSKTQRAYKASSGRASNAASPTTQFNATSTAGRPASTTTQHGTATQPSTTTQPTTHLSAEAAEIQQAAEAAKDAAERAKKAANSVGMKRSIGGFFRGLFFGLLIGAVAMFFLGKAYISKHYGTHNAEELGADNVIEEHLTGYTAVDFKDAILGEAQGHQELIVMEEPMQLTSMLHKEGPWDLEVFRRTKNVTYYGTGVYTVDLSKLNSGKIRVDEASKKVIITVPHAALQYVNPDFSKIEFEDTEMGLLAFTDIRFTAEEQAALEISMTEEMRTLLSSAELMKAADDFAVMKLWDLFQPLVSAVSPDYRLEILFG